MRTDSQLLHCLVSRRTTQRRAILAALSEAQGPLTAQEVHERASKELAGIGLATVYRNLNVLADAGEIVAIHLPQDPARYELAGRAHHHHFRCEGCATVFELYDSCPIDPLEGRILPGGLKVTGHELVLFGFCSDCQALTGTGSPLPARAATRGRASSH